MSDELNPPESAVPGPPDAGLAVQARLSPALSASPALSIDRGLGTRLGHLAGRPPESRAQVLPALSRTNGNRAVSARVCALPAETDARESRTVHSPDSRALARLMSTQPSAVLTR